MAESVTKCKFIYEKVLVKSKNPICIMSKSVVYFSCREIYPDTQRFE